MLARAEEVSHVGEPMGIFDFLVWAHADKQRLFLVLGRQVIDVFREFGSEVDNGVLRSARAVYVAGCRVRNGNLMTAHEIADVNHWVVAVPLHGHIRPIDEPPVADHLPQQLLQMGFGLVETQAV